MVGDRLCLDWVSKCGRRPDLRRPSAAHATHWIVVGAVVLLEVRILSGVQETREKDPLKHGYFPAVEKHLALLNHR